MMTKLLYADPGIDTLHAEYAARGRIDTRAPVIASRDVVMAAPVATVWALLSDPRAWGVSTPPSMTSGWTPRCGRAPGSPGATAARRSPPGSLSWTRSGRSPGPGCHPRPGQSTGIYSPLRRAPHSPDVRRVDGRAAAAAVFGRAKLATSLESWLAAIKAAAERAMP
jgi:hypothetical protein